MGGLDLEAINLLTLLYPIESGAYPPVLGGTDIASGLTDRRFANHLLPLGYNLGLHEVALGLLRRASVRKGQKVVSHSKLNLD